MSIKWMNYKNKPILYVDYRGLAEVQALELLELEAKMIAAAPTKALILDNYEGYSATPKYMERAKELGRAVMERNTAKNAALGVTGVKEILMWAYNAFTGGHLQSFHTEAEALEWLVKD